MNNNKKIKTITVKENEKKERHEETKNEKRK